MLRNAEYIVMRNAVGEEIRRVVHNSKNREAEELNQMLGYALGWEGEGSGETAQGKRIRPVLLLLVTEAAGGDWHRALPAAAAIELLHNFSLIHDDIEDSSHIRRGRPTLWKQWGIPHAINTGDMMFALANHAILDLSKEHASEMVIDTASIFLNTCIRLTQGQFLDLAFENRSAMTLDEYSMMVEGKTAALLAAAAEIGALLSGVDQSTRENYREYGKYLGLAYQAHDDYLGVWGDQALTGKSSQSDLVAGKKSLPVVYAMQTSKKLATTLNQGGVAVAQVPAVASQLTDLGAGDYTQQTAAFLTDQAIRHLKKAQPAGRAGKVLAAITDILLKRKT